jgi:hypothetical protein
MKINEETIAKIKPMLEVMTKGTAKELLEVHSTLIQLTVEYFNETHEDEKIERTTINAMVVNNER